ncbi:MAG: hypothetical protein KAT46_02040 [Deltaproteobacteria bacterium]|nr:hypothetical protein [Deltaproteobacteria bacterium]
MFHKIFEDPKKTKVIRMVLYVLMVVFIIWDVLMERHHMIFPWDYVPGFSALYGFVSCVLIIVISKIIGKLWLQKKEGYYDK